MDISDLNLDQHGLDKLLRLVGDRYDRESNTLTITADRCPLHSQNIEYCRYLLTVIRAETEVGRAGVYHLLTVIWAETEVCHAIGVGVQGDAGGVSRDVHI